jgi:hypothetical protein
LLNGDGRANWGPGAIRGLIVSELNVILWAELMIPLCSCVFASTGFRYVRNKHHADRLRIFDMGDDASRLRGGLMDRIILPAIAWTWLIKFQRHY